MNKKFGKGSVYNTSDLRYNKIIESTLGKDPKDITPKEWYELNDIFKITRGLYETSIFNGGGKKPKAPKVDTSNVNGEVFRRLSNPKDMVNFFDAVTNKVQGPQEFMKRVIKIDENFNLKTNKSNAIGNLMNFDSLYDNVKKVERLLSGKQKGSIAVFDLETLSGINQFGHSVLSNITEISGVKFKVENGAAQIEKKINTVLGFTQDEALKAREKLSNIMSRGRDSWTNEEKVFFERMNIYGHSKARQNGFNFEIYDAKGIEDIKTSRLNAEKGIAFLEDVANKQQQWMKSQGINDTYSEYRKAQLLDFKKMLQESTIAQGHNIQGFDINQLNIATGDNSPLNNLHDTLQSALYAQKEFGANSIYAPGAERKNLKTGRATQATLAEIHNLKDRNLAAHIAENDVMENALFLFGDIKGGSSYKDGTINISDNSYFNNVILKNMEKLKKNYDKTSALYKGEDQLYYMDYTMQKNFANQNGALSFEYDPITKSYKTYDGFNIKDGKVSDAGFPAFGPRKGAVYQHGVYQLEMNESFKKQFMNVTGAGEDQANKIFQQYSNSKYLYMIESKQYMDLDELTKKLGSRELAEHYYNNRPTTYTFETNYDRLGANLGINIGEVKNVKENNKKIFSSYLKDPYDKNKYQNIKNTAINKPRYGLWASSLNGDTTAWKEWNEHEGTGKELSNRIDFTLKDNAKVLNINENNINTLKDFTTTVDGIQVIDYEKLAKQYDALYVSQDFVDKHRMGKDYKSFYAWDIESLVVFNQDAMDFNIPKAKTKSKVILNEQAIKALNFKRTEASPAGTAIVKGTDVFTTDGLFEKIMDKSYDRTINDSAARRLRELDYKKIMQIRNYQKDLINNKGINSDRPIVTRISQLVSQGKDIDLTTHSEIVNALGWNDFVKKENKIVKESINSIMSLDGQVNRMGNLFDAIDEVLNETFGILDLSTPDKYSKAMADPNNREILWKKDMAFKQIYNDYLDTVSANPVYANMWSPTIATAEELNKIDFNLYDINPKEFGKKIHGPYRNKTTDILSIDLNKPDSLLNTFFNAKFGDLNSKGLVNKDSNAGYDALYDAYHKIRSDKRFKINGRVEIFNNIDINDRSQGVSALNDAMTEELRKFSSTMREKDGSWGYLNPRQNMNVLDANLLTDFIGKQSKDEIKETLNVLKSNLPKDYKLLTNGASHDEAVNKLVNDYFLSFNLDDLKKDMGGFTDNQKMYITKQYETALETAKGKADSLLKAIQGTDINLYMTDTKTGPTLSLVQGNKVQELTDMFRFQNRDGMITYSIGDNDYAFKAALGRYKEKDRSKVFKFSNNVEKITSTNLDHMHAKWATDRKESIFDAIVYNNKQTAKKLRDTTARLDIMNGQVHSLGFQFNADELISALPDLYEDKIIESVESKYKISEGAKKSMRDVIDKIKKDPRYFKDKSFTKILPVELNFFTGEYMQPLMETIFNSDDFDETEKKILKGVGVDSKNTALFKGNLSGVSNYYIDPLAKMDNDARPPVTQMQNTRLYNKNATTKGVTELKAKDKIYKNLNATSVYTSDNMEKYLYNNMSSTGEAATSGLTMKYMQIDSYTLRNQFLDQNNISKMDKYLEAHVNKSDLDRAKEVIRDRAKRLSTYEQQSNMDARVHDINFHRTNSQTINAKKKAIFDHSLNVEIIEDNKKIDKLHFIITDDGKIQYQLGVKVKKNQVLGQFGNDDFMQKVRAKNDGMFRGRFFDSHGNVVSEDVLNKFIKDNNLAGDNATLLEKLNSKFTYKYQVLGLEEKHGAKVFLGASEKTTIDSMKLGVGEINSELVNKLKGTEAEDIIGKVVDKDYLEEVARKQLENKYGADEADNIIKSIYKERYMFSDAIHEIDAFKDVQFITNLDVLKHSSATALMHNGLNELRLNGQLTEKNLNDLFGKGNYELVGSGEDAQVKIKETLKEVDFTRILNGDNKELTAAFTKDTRVMKDGKSIGHTGLAHINQVIDDSAGTSSGVFNGEVIGKGVKFTDAMGRNLDRQTYNLDAMENIYSHYLDKGQLDEFKNLFGHALDLDKLEHGQLAFNDQYRNTSIAKPITDRLRERLVKSDYSQTLEEVAVGDNREKYDHLIKSVKEDRLGNVSVDRAELMYSYKRGLEAMEINNVANSATVTKYMNAPDYKNFKLIDWTVDNPDWLDLQIGGQGNTVTNSDMNPYTNNLVIRTGFGGQDEYLAIARMPEKHAGDTLVQKEHVSMLTGLQNKMKQYKEGNLSKDKVVDHINLYKKVMQEDITGKEGLIKNLTEYRMEQSFMGKGSGIIMAAFDEKNKTLLGSGDVDTLNQLNAKVFSQAKFNGQTLNQHYAEGRVVDALFMSENAFRDMGYFDESFMDKTLGENLGNLNKKTIQSLTAAEIDLGDREAVMKHLLATEGDSFISVRYPEIMQGSDKFTMGYLDADLKANEMRVLGPTGMSAKLDFDGDQMNAARVATSKGLSSLHSAVTNIADDELLDFKNSFNASVATRAITDNAYWEREVNKFMTGKKGHEMTSAAMDLKSIASHKLINGKVYLDGIEDRTELELRQLHTKYKDVLSEKYTSDDDLVAAVNAIDKGDLNEYVAAASWQNKRDMVTAKVYNNAIGETNVTNQKIKSSFMGLLNEADPEYEYKSNLIFDFLYQAEEQAISSKSSVEGLSADRAQQWNRSISGLIKGTGNRAEHLETAENWLSSNLRGNFASGLYYAKSSTFQNKIYNEFKVNTLEGFNELLKDSTSSSKVDDILIGDIMNMIEEVSTMKGADKIYDSLRIASSQSGGSHWLAQGMNFINEQETNLKTVYNAFKENFGEELSDNLSRASFTSDKEFFNSIESLVSDAANNAPKLSTEEKIGGIIDGIGDFAKSASGKKLAMGAVGIAAGIMVAGFVGGRPRPADVHAMEEAQDYQTPMEGYQLADPSLMPGGGQQGYVININARTNKGRDNAVQALQQAISSGGNANINIAMNITDNYGNINDRELEKAILGAF